MPAFNMGGTAASNPSAGHAVIMSPFSGPKGSPFDAKKTDPADPYSLEFVADTANLSTGALSTGIGFGPDCRVPGQEALFDEDVPSSVNNFSDDYEPGITMPGGTAATEAVLTCIGGGNMTYPDVDPGLYPDLDPYLVQPLLAFGNGGSRDAGAGPAYTGFGMKEVTAAADIANGAAIETGWVNRSGVTLPDTMSQFGVSTTASPEVLTEEPPEPPPEP